MQAKAVIGGLAVAGGALAATQGLDFLPDQEAGAPVELSREVEPQPSVVTAAATAESDGEPAMKVSLMAVPTPEGGDDITFCYPVVLPGDGCASRAEILSMDGRPVDRVNADGSTRFAKMRMVGPELSDPEQEVETCESFAPLAMKGWGGLTGVDMAREAQFTRYCGMKAMASRAAAPRTTPFEGPLAAADLEAIPAAQWPRFGPVGETTPVVTAVEGEKGAWSADTGALMMRIQDVAHADFDGDGVGEHLLYIGVRARGGTAGFSQYALLQKDAGEMILRRIDWAL